MVNKYLPSSLPGKFLLMRLDVVINKKQQQQQQRFEQLHIFKIFKFLFNYQQAQTATKCGAKYMHWV